MILLVSPWKHFLCEILKHASSSPLHPRGNSAFSSSHGFIFWVPAWGCVQDWRSDLGPLQLTVYIWFNGLGPLIFIGPYTMFLLLSLGVDGCEMERFMMTVTANSKRHLKLGMSRYKRLSKTILMNETNSNTTKLGHVVGVGVYRECDAESRAHFPNRAHADLWLHKISGEKWENNGERGGGKSHTATPPHFPLPRSLASHFDLYYSILPYKQEIARRVFLHMLQIFISKTSFSCLS